MEILFEWIKFFLGTGILIFGMSIFVLEVLGLYRFRYVLNRMHVAAVGDTLGIAISLTGLMIMSGFRMVTLKFVLVIFFFWLASPVSSHLIARLEIITNEKLKDYCEVKE